jgi:uncharacterized membrane protein
VKVVKLVSIAVALSFAIAIAVAWFLPSSWEVERSVRITAPPARIHAWLDDLARWPQWMPWGADRDPTFEVAFEGPQRGVGAVLVYTGERLGRGRIELVESDPSRGVAYETTLDRTKIPARGSFRFEREGEAIRVTWRDAGDLGGELVARLFLPLLRAQLGRDLQKSLERLRQSVEAEIAAEQRERAQPAARAGG